MRANDQTNNYWRHPLDVGVGDRVGVGDHDRDCGLVDRAGLSGGGDTSDVGMLDCVFEHPAVSGAFPLPLPLLSLPSCFDDFSGRTEIWTDLETMTFVCAHRE